MNLTPDSLALFLAYAKDAGNWSGTPLVGGNVPDTTPEAKGNLTDLKRKKLISTFRDEGNTWLTFTEKGFFLAKEHGIDLSANYTYGDKE